MCHRLLPAARLFFFLYLFELGEAFAERLFFAVRLRVVNFDTFELLGHVFLCRIGAGAIVIVLVVDSVAQLFSDLGDRIAEGARHGESSCLLHDRVRRHAGDFYTVALGGER